MAPLVLCDRNDDLVLTLPSNQFADRYFFLNPDGSPPADDKSASVRAIGSGGFGYVFRCRDTVGLQRAIKLLKPEMEPEDSSDDGSSVFEREIVLTNRIPYKHVLPIIDYGRVDEANEGVRYYVMPYVDGIPLIELNARLDQWRQVITADETLVRRLRSEVMHVVNDLLAGLVELASAEVVHMDIKPANALIFPSPLSGKNDIAPQAVIATLLNPSWRMRGFIIDLGCGKQVGSDSPAIGRTRLRRTPYYFPNHLLTQLDHDHQSHTISRERLAQLWRSIDLYSFGRSLESIFLDRGRRKSKRFEVNATSGPEEYEKELFWRAVFGDEFGLLEGLTDKLMATDPSAAFQTARGAKLSFASINDTQAQGVLASETLITRSETAVQMEVGDTTVSIPSRLLPIVNHPVFRRLSGVHQLSLVQDIYPDATHNRLAHSLRTFELTKQAILALSRRSQFRLLFIEPRAVDELLLAALLHDVGQYHFAHSLEDLRKMADLRGDQLLASIPHDQDLLPEMCALSYADSEPLLDILARLGVDARNIFYMVQKTRREDDAPAHLNISRDLINGVVDMDRVSYLLHDGQRTGVAHGRSVDIPSLLNALTIRADAEAVGLAVEIFGVSAAESVLAAIYWMYRRVYWHPENRAFMAALKFVVMRLMRLRLLTFAAYRHDTFGNTDLFAVRYLSSLFDEFREASATPIENPLRPLTEFRPLGYRVILGIARGASQALYDRVLGTITADRQEAFLVAVRTEFLKGRCEARDGDVLIDVPFKGRLPEHGQLSEEETEGEIAVRSPLWVCERGLVTGQITGWSDLRKYSPLANTFSAAEKGSGREIRVFLSERVASKMSATTKVFVENSLLGFVDQWTKTWGEAQDNSTKPVGHSTDGGSNDSTPRQSGRSRSGPKRPKP